MHKSRQAILGNKFYWYSAHSTTVNGPLVQVHWIAETLAVGKGLCDHYYHSTAGR